MNYDFINELVKTLESTNLFRYTITGSKTLALALLGFKLLETFTRDIEANNSETPTVANYLNIVGFGLIIMSSDWIITTIESVFSSVSSQMNMPSNDIYTIIEEEINMKIEQTFADADGWMDYMVLLGDSIGAVLGLVIVSILVVIVKIADMCIVTSYLLLRIFFIKLLVFLFPLAIALSTLDATKNLLGSWIKRYIGVFLLGIAYMGIISFTNLIVISMSEQFGEVMPETFGLSGLAWGSIVTVCLAFSVKVKLFSSVTSYITNMFQ